MDRQVIDDILCCTLILVQYLNIQIERLNIKIDEYTKQIETYNDMRVNPLLNSNILSAS